MNCFKHKKRLRSENRSLFLWPSQLNVPKGTIGFKIKGRFADPDVFRKAGAVFSQFEALSVDSAPEIKQIPHFTQCIFTHSETSFP